MMEVIDKAEFEPWMISVLEPLIAKLVSKVEVTKIEPVLCSIEEATVIIGRSKRFVIDAIARGLIDAKKSDKRVLLVVQSLKDYIAALPAAKGTLNHRRPVTTKMDREIIASRAKRERERARAA
jgi:hypothetical protein